MYIEGCINKIIKINKVVGIDLGTTNSVVAAIEGGQPAVIINAEGVRTTPSIVAYTKKQELLVGQIAKRQAVINPENTFFSIKRFIGSKESEIPSELKELPFEIGSDSDGGIRIKCSSFNKEFSPEEISAQVLRKLISDASKYLGQKVAQAVITVPAYFNDSQRQATLDAGQIAGIDVLRIINEPTAASLAYGLDKKQNQTILVFDLGGGTFDVSILEVGDGIFEVLATAGDTNLGGDNFDKILVNWLIDDFNKNEKIDLSGDVQALQRLTEATEKAKIELSTIKKTQINLPFITADQTGPKHIDKELTRELFEKLCKDLIDYCKTPVEKALNDAEITKLDIDEVVLVGGSTRIPAIQELVKTMTNKKINQNVNPDEVVAIGAAIQAGILAGEIKDILLLDVTPLSLGIETLGGVMTKVIPRNTTVPVRRSELFSTALDNQTSVEIHILQGERELVLGNKSLGRFGLTNIPEAEKGVPQIDVTFDLNVDGLLNVTAKERATGVEQFISLKDTSNLNEEEIKRMLEDAKKYAESDLEQKETIEAQNESEDFCLEIESFLLTYEKTKQLEKNTKEFSNSIFHLLDLLKFQVRNGKLSRVELLSFTEGIKILFKKLI